MEIKKTSTKLFQGTIFKVEKDEVILEDTKHIAIREIVRHPGGVGILAMDGNDILLVSQFRYVITKTLLEIPAGKLEEKENPIAAAHRELEEETGYQCRSLKLICPMLSSPGFLDEQVSIYEAEGVFHVEHPLQMDEDERITLHRIPLHTAYQMILEGLITDAKTVIAIQYAMLQKKDFKSLL